MVFCSYVLFLRFVPVRFRFVCRFGFGSASVRFGSALVRFRLVPVRFRFVSYGSVRFGFGSASVRFGLVSVQLIAVRSCSVSVRSNEPERKKRTFIMEHYGLAIVLTER